MTAPSHPVTTTLSATATAGTDALPGLLFAMDSVALRKYLELAATPAIARGLLGGHIPQYRLPSALQA